MISARCLRKRKYLILAMLFKEVVGQQEVKSRMIHEINSEKISHAQLFLGQTGYGSFALALAYIQYLFCENRSESDACGVCPSCQKNNHLSHPDVHFVFPTVQAISKTADPMLKEWRAMVSKSPYFDLNDWINFIDDKGRRPIIGTDESKELLHKLSLMSYEGGFKVVVIWMAEEMNTAFSNKILKTLEEPTAKTLLILVVENGSAILPTILSRTQIRKIPRLQYSEGEDYTKRISNLPEGEIVSLVARVEGDICAVRSSIGNAEAENGNRELFIELMRSAFKKNVIEMMDWAEKISSIGREQQKIFLEYAVHMCRQSMLKNYTDDQLTRVSNEEAAFLKNFAKFITGNNIVDFMKIFSESHYEIERNANPKILFTHLAFRAMRFIHFA
jgi:DNA polymerase III subunit delta'